MVITHEELKYQTAQQDSLVQRLQAEKHVLFNEAHQKARQEGFELGIRSSSTLSYKDFRHFERVNSLAVSFDEDVLDYLWTFLDEKGYPQQARVQDFHFAQLLETDAQARILFTQGWLEGVLSVWNTIKAEVDVEG